MANRTFNRRPQSVNVTGTGESGKTFFNHANWKGINQNRNFLTVDQETFADANNVFIDDKGLLVSRLPLKLKNRVTNKRIVDINTYGKIAICLYQNQSGEWYIGAISDAIWVADIRVTGIGKLKTFRNGDYVYIFTDRIIRYDDDSKSFDDAKLYIPITRIYDGEDFENFEEDNLFSSYSKYRYLLYPSTIGEWLSDYLPKSAYGKNVDYEYYVNDDIKRYSVDIDVDNNFLGQVHSPLLYNEIDIKTTNCYGMEVPLIFCHNNFLYRYDKGKILRLSLTDQKYKLLREFKHSDDNFVKFKYQYTGHILVIYKDSVHTMDLDGNDVPLYFPLGTYVDCAICKVHDDLEYAAVYWKQKIEAGNVAKNSYDLVVDYYNYYKDTHTRVKIVTSNGTIGADADLLLLSSGHCGLVSFSVRTSSISLQNTLSLPTLSGSYNDRGNFKSTSEPSPDYSDSWSYDLIYEQTDITSFGFLDIYNLVQIVSDGDSYEIYAGARHGRHNFYYGRFNLADNEFSNSLVLSESVLKVYGTKNYYIFDNGSLSFNSNAFLENVDEFVITNNGYWFAKFDGVILSNYRVSVMNLDAREPSENNYSGVEFLIKNNDVFVSNRNDLFVGNIMHHQDEEFLWFKKSFKHVLENEIVGFHRVSDVETAIFTTDDTWYVKFSDSVYYYFPTKIKPVLKNNSEIITLLDSTTTLIPAKEGIMVLSYQNFVNTTEQSTHNLTENIMEIYNDFNSSVKCVNWKNYVLFYENNNNVILLLDIRNNSWWKWSLPKDVSKLFVYDNLLYAICEGTFYEFSCDLTVYSDETDTNLKINWHFESQKLHFNANNHYKHLINLTLFGLEENDQPLSLDLNIKNYRKYVNEGKPENFDYRIDVIRTFVKRLNYAKVCEFQYKLSSDENNAIDAPLALSGISIKHKIGGQVR